MGLRLIKLPADLIPLATMISDSFHYPENASWSIQSDEQEQLLDAIKNLNRIWPLIRLIQSLSPTLKDILRGYVWEEDGQIVGATIVQRRGNSDTWVVGTVGVLPAYRRKGIARALVEAALSLIREHHGTKAILSVIDGNLPAYTLYESLGFKHYDNSIQLHLTPTSAHPAPVLPAGYVQSSLARFDWETRHQLEKRISPQQLLEYEPVEVSRFRQPFMTRLLLPVIMLAQGTREEGFAIHTRDKGLTVARGEYNTPARGKGVSGLWARLDPDHSELASYMAGYMLHKVTGLSPGIRAELLLPQWMAALVQAAEEAGFTRRLQYCRMGLIL